MRLFDMRWTRSTYCCACSWKMSVAGHDDCIFRTIGDCAVTTDGMAKAPAAAPAARVPPFRNLRLDTSFSAISVISFPPSLVGMGLALQNAGARPQGRCFDGEDAKAGRLRRGWQ